MHSLFFSSQWSIFRLNFFIVHTSLLVISVGFEIKSACIVFNNNKCYQCGGDAFTKQKFPLFSLSVDEQMPLQLGGILQWKEKDPLETTTSMTPIFSAFNSKQARPSAQNEPPALQSHFYYSVIKSHWA